MSGLSIEERRAIRAGWPVPRVRAKAAELRAELELAARGQHVLPLSATPTIWFPDLSHYDLDRGLRLQAGTVAVIVKATHGTAFLDRGFGPFRTQAGDVAAWFTAYHWLNHGDAADQAAFFWRTVGRVPVMVDAEDTAANTGYNGPLTVADIVEFVTTLRELGGTSNLGYLPHWYWQDHMGSPDLTPLARAGIGLVSSNYTTYSDTGPGWAGYGGVDPVQWQYTDACPYGGAACDFNAFRGFLADYIALTTKGSTDVNLTDIVPATGGVNVGDVLSDLFNNIQYGHSGYVPTNVGFTGRQLNALVAAAAADQVRDAATLAAVNALADLIKAGGGNVDTAAILAEIRAAAADAQTTAQRLQADLDAAAQREHELHGRLAEALAEGPASA
jgi:hypothetical protein